MTLDSQLLITKTYQVEPYQWMDPIRDQMEAVELSLLSVPEGQHEWITLATKHLLGAGGKRIRPAVSLLASGIFEVDHKQANSLASGVEMLHTATLVHDDLIDGADKRRGKPTLNAVSGSDAAILVGDYLFSRAANLVAQTDHVRVMDEFAKTLMVIVNGEVAQRFSRWQIDRESYEQRIYAKTAALFVLASHAAGLLGKADPSQLQALVTYGRAVGMAFQIVDDVLDYTGDTVRIGKPAGGDLRQGLVTLPLILYLETYPEDPDISLLLSRKNGEDDAVDRLVEKIRHSAAIESALCEANFYIEQARQALDALPPSIYTQCLADLALTVVDRAL